MGAAVFLALSSLLPAPAARAAEFEIAADSFTVLNQVNISSVAYFQTRAIPPSNPALATQLLTPGGLYFDATYYNVWDRTALAWVKLATGTVEAGRVAKAGDFMSGQLTTASTITVQGNAFSVGASTFVVIGGNVGMGTASPGQVLDVNGGVNVSSGIVTGSWVVGGCVNPGNATDIMVPVGDLCVDKYEAAVYGVPTGGAPLTSYPCAANGQNCAAIATAIYARSVSGVTPARSITWFQASVACRNAGKHLLTNAEWQDAAVGTVDPGATGTAPNCNIAGTGPTTTGAGTSCLSSYGVENMIGSMSEWTADWGQYGSDNSVTNGDYTNTAWSAGASYGNDATWNLGGAAYTTEGARNAYITGLPVAVVRGGHWVTGPSAGVFAFNADNGPSYWSIAIGFRCGRRR